MAAESIELPDVDTTYDEVCDDVDDADDDDDDEDDDVHVVFFIVSSRLLMRLRDGHSRGFMHAFDSNENISGVTLRFS